MSLKTVESAYGFIYTYYIINYSEWWYNYACVFFW